MIIKDCCSYCQRPYGQISTVSKLPIFKTIDHIKPVNDGGGSNCNTNRKSRNRGMHSLKNYKLTDEELDNLVECCNECNILKDNYYLRVFNYKLNHKKFLQKSSARYLTPKLISNIKNSIQVLLINETEEIELKL